MIHRAPANIERYLSAADLQLAAMSIKGAKEVISLTNATGFTRMSAATRVRVVELVTKAKDGPLIKIARGPELKICHTLSMAALSSIIQAVKKK